MLGGALEIDSSPKSGTRVVLHVPTSARPDRPGAAPPPGFGGDPTSFSPADAGRG
jgi:hypothetical protein